MITIPGGRLSGNPSRGFPNLAGHPDPDAIMTAELEAAGIEAVSLGFNMDERDEVKQCVMGQVGDTGWGFKRAWYYWVAKGPGIPPDIAEKLHATHGQVVRVEGHCGCPSPLEYRHGFAIGSYHVDSPDGLKALADTIKSIFAENSKEATDDPSQPRAEFEINLTKPPLAVRHRDLERLSDSSEYKSRCPSCLDGMLPMLRDAKTHQLLCQDCCIVCGQRFLYTDIVPALELRYTEP